MSKEFRCTQCRKKIITEREDRRHTDYTYGLCEDCKSKPVQVLALQDEVNPLTCTVCGFSAKSEFGLKSHMRVHK